MEAFEEHINISIFDSKPSLDTCSNSYTPSGLQRSMIPMDKLNVTWSRSTLSGGPLAAKTDGSRASKFQVKTCGAVAKPINEVT